MNNVQIYDGDELYATLMSYSEFHKEVIDKYVIFLSKHKNASSSFINDRLRLYCREENIGYSIKSLLECVESMDEYVREEIKLGNR